MKLGPIDTSKPRLREEEKNQYLEFVYFPLTIELSRADCICSIRLRPVSILVVALKESKQNSLRRKLPAKRMDSEKQSTNFYLRWEGKQAF